MFGLKFQRRYKFEKRQLKEPEYSNKNELINSYRKDIITYLGTYKEWKIGTSSSRIDSKYVSQDDSSV